MTTRGPKQLLFDQFASVAKTLGHAHRLELIEQLAQGERSVEVLAARVGLSIANASQHLQQLRRAGLVTTRRAGKFVHYRLSDEAVIDLLGAIRRVAERNLAEVGQVVRSYFEQRDALEAVSREELMQRLQKRSVTVLDVRPEDEYALGHVPGAINVPLHALKSHLAKLSRSKEIVAYCRGPYCVLSFEAVALLREKGFKVRRLEEGMPEWRAAGFPVAQARA